MYHHVIENSNISNENPENHPVISTTNTELKLQNEIFIKKIQVAFKIIIYLLMFISTIIITNTTVIATSLGDFLKVPFHVGVIYYVTFINSIYYIDLSRLTSIFKYN